MRFPLGAGAVIGLLSLLSPVQSTSSDVQSPSKPQLSSTSTGVRSSTHSSISNASSTSRASSISHIVLSHSNAVPSQSKSGLRESKVSSSQSKVSPSQSKVGSSQSEVGSSQSKVSSSQSEVGSSQSKVVTSVVVPASTKSSNDQTKPNTTALDPGYQMPLPEMATILTGTVGSERVIETYVPHIFQQYTTISAVITTTTTLVPGDKPVTVVVGPAGLGWVPYHEANGALELPAPPVLPPPKVASLDTNFTSDPIPSSPISKSTAHTTAVSAVDRNTRSSASHKTSVNPASRPTTSVPVQTRPSKSTGKSSSSSSSSKSGASKSINAGHTSLSPSKPEATKLGATRPGDKHSSKSRSAEVITPAGYVTTAFNNPKESVTTLSANGSAAIIYSKETFPDLATITSPTTIQTHVVKTEDSSTSTFIGAIVVGPGGVYWGPPGLPELPPFPGITPPCIWPFCTGGGGGGGSSPPGDEDPPPPYTPDDPHTPDSNEPTKNPEKQHSTKHPDHEHERSSETKSPSSTSSCSVHTYTDVWVSCAAGATSACSTYSTSVASGCKGSAFTTTVASACPLAARASPDPTIAGMDYGNGEYPRLADGYTDIESFQYTVAHIAPTGVIPEGAGPPGSSRSTTAPKTTKKASTRSITGKPPAKTEGSPICVHHVDDPYDGVPGECECSSGTHITTLPILTNSKNICGYTKYPAPAPHATTSSVSVDPWPFTFTDLQSGPIIACKSSLVGNAGVQYTVCKGDRKTVGTDSAIYSKYTSATRAKAEADSSSAAAAAASASASAAAPRAECTLSDDIVAWGFEITGINNWAGDDGHKLHSQEGGCGALTGWSWHNDNGEQRASFNLPFFMKDGCVERAIAHAGGPKGLSCKKGGVTRRSVDAGSQSPRRRFPTDVNAVRERRNSEIEQAVEVAKREVLLSIKPAASFDTSPAPKRLSARAELANLYARGLDARDLEKRGCLDWLWPGAGIPKEWWCNCVIPGVDGCAQAISKKGMVGRYPSIFYTSWYGVGDGSLGVQGAKNWATNNICGRSVDFDGIVATAWMIGVEIAIEKPFGPQGLKFTKEKKDEIVDPFLKNLSQAFAEESAGEAYVVIPKGASFKDESAWAGWEYPALTRNPKITNVWKIELDITDEEQLTSPKGNPKFTKTLLWAPHMGKSATEPKGSRTVELPDQVPEDDIPENWQTSL